MSLKILSKHIQLKKETKLRNRKIVHEETVRSVAKLESLVGRNLTNKQQVKMTYISGPYKGCDRRTK